MLGRSSSVGQEPSGNSKTVQISGVIKWFDAAKGFGFIVPDGGGQDVLLHITCLQRGGYKTAFEGSRIVCETLARPKGLQALKVLSMDESAAIHPKAIAVSKNHSRPDPIRVGGLERATVKWFDRGRGFGFLTRGEGTPDIFVHMETLRRCGFTELCLGQTVLVRSGPGPKGMAAAEVRLDEPAKRAAE